MEPLVEVDDASVVRAGQPILKQATWQAYPGQHWVVLGPNGAGKTTLVSLLAGRLFPTRGAVGVVDEELGSVATEELHQRVGFCSSALARAVPADLPVYNTVLAAAYGTIVRTAWQTYEDVDLRRAEDLMAAFGVTHLKERVMGTLSDGERQRVYICRALMADPEVLILDEPAAGVDLGARETLLGALAELSADPRSPLIVLVTHHLEEIPPGFTHALLMDQGQIRYSGPIDQVLTGDNLTAVFGMPLQVGRHADGRWWAHAARPGR